MELPRTLSFLSYAVNGAGLGHVVRLCAINRWLRRYSTFAGVRSQHVFLTTSEADSWLFHEGFAAFKLPSKSIVETAGMSKPTYLALAKTWVWNAMSTLRPDLLVVDTFPNGSFDELAPALDLCRRKALVLRPVNAETAARPGFRALVGLYERIIVPAEPGVEVPVPGDRADLVRHVGPIMRTERWEALPREQARRRLGVEGDSFCLLVSGGGGGDETVGRLFASVAGALADLDVHVVYAAGPLYQGEPLRGSGRTWWTEPALAECLTGIDAAVSASGFNTVHELMHQGVPTALFAQQKVADDQAARARGFVAAGAALPLTALTAEAVRSVVAQLRDPQTTERLSHNARQAVPDNGARRAAAALLELVLPRSVVRHAVEAVDDVVLAGARSASVAFEDLVDVAVALTGSRGGVDRAALELDDALPLLERASATGCSAHLLARIVTTFGRKLTTPVTPEVLARAAMRLLGASAVVGQSSAVASLLDLLGPERDRSPERFAEDLTGLLETAAAAGLSVFQVVERTMRLQHEAAAPPSNGALVRRLRELMVPAADEAVALSHGELA